MAVINVNFRAGLQAKVLERRQAVPAYVPDQSEALGDDEIINIDSLIAAKMSPHDGLHWLYLEVAAVSPIPPIEAFRKAITVRFHGPQGLDLTVPVEAIPDTEPDPDDDDGTVRLLLLVNVQGFFRGFTAETKITVKASPNSPSFTDSLLRLNGRHT